MITHDELRRIFDLAYLYAGEQELESAAEEIGSIIDFAAQVVSAPVSAVDDACDAEYRLRDDEISASLPADKILQNAPHSEDGYFVFRHGGGGTDD